MGHNSEAQIGLDGEQMFVSVVAAAAAAVDFTHDLLTCGRNVSFVKCLALSIV